MENAVSDNLGQELLNKQDEEKTADQGQVEVVDLEEEVELEGLATTHELSATEDDDVVADEHGGSLLEGSHWGLSRDEAEVLGLVALDRGEGLLEDGPQLETEGTVKRGHAVADPFGGRHCWRDWAARDAFRGVGLQRQVRGRRPAKERQRWQRGDYQRVEKTRIGPGDRVEDVEEEEAFIIKEVGRLKFN